MLRNKNEAIRRFQKLFAEFELTGDRSKAMMRVGNLMLLLDRNRKEDMELYRRMAKSVNLRVRSRRRRLNGNRFI